MKKALKRIVCAFAVMVMAAFSLVILSSCGGNIEMPKGNVVVGNGTDVVQVGKYEGTGINQRFVPEYIYFANGYKSYEDLKEGKDNENVNVADLVRVKLDVSGNLEHDGNGDVKGLEVICSKIVGSEHSAMFVVGDYIYFSSPNTHKTNENKHQFQLISIFRVKLDGTDLKEIYTTPEYSGGSYTVLSHSGKDYLVIYTGSRLVKFEIGRNVGDRVELAKEVTGLALPKYGETFGGEIYFTTDRTEEQQNNGQTGNILNKVNIGSGDVSVRSNINAVTISLVGVYNDELFFTKGGETFRYNTTSTASVETAVKVAYVALSEIFDMGVGNSGTHRGYVFSYGSKLWRISKAEVFDGTSGSIMEEAPHILAVAGDYIYYSSGSSINRISRFGGTSQKVFESDNMIATKISVEGQYVYFYDMAQDEEIEDDDDNIIRFPDQYFMYRISTAAAETGNEIKPEVMAVRKGEVKEITISE